MWVLDESGDVTSDAGDRLAAYRRVRDALRARIAAEVLPPGGG